MQCHVQVMYTYTALWIMLMCGSHHLINQAGWNNVMLSYLIYLSVYVFMYLCALSPRVVGKFACA